MTEISVMGANELSVWGWEVALYLFLGGLAAGLLVLSGLAQRGGAVKLTVKAAPMIALAVLSAGMFFLFLDLERKLHVFRFYTTFQWSAPMSWGAWILALVYPVAAAFTFLRTRWLANLAVAAGGALGIYTGILLSALGAHPLWNSAILGVLFLVSGISGGAALLMLIERDQASRHSLAAIDLKLMAAEGLALFLLLAGLATGGAAQRAAAHLLLGGAYTAYFWAVVVVAGLALPAAIEFMQRRGWAQPSAYAPVFVLLGGFALRTVLLFAGQASGWGVDFYAN